MARRKPIQEATLENLLRLFSQRLRAYKGESRRSYQKAYSSFQLYVVGKVNKEAILEERIIGDWVIDNFLQGLSPKTVSFYLDKIASLYSGIAPQLEGGREPLFKNIKKKLKDCGFVAGQIQNVVKTGETVKDFVYRKNKKGKKSILVDTLLRFPIESNFFSKVRVRYLWGSLALCAGIPADQVRGMLDDLPHGLGFLNITDKKRPNEKEITEMREKIEQNLKGEEPQWFAMRLRPKVKFDMLMQRFSELNPLMSLPEIFYPMEEITRRVGRKLQWTGRPVIRDVVFFKTQRKEIYPLFTRLYDLAWCYRTPGGKTGNYASIPGNAMEDFKKSLGFIGPGFEVSPTGEKSLKPGDKVVIVNGDYASELAKIIKEEKREEDSRTIYRVTLLNSNGHWDIGIDARLLKKAEN